MSRKIARKPGYGSLLLRNRDSLTSESQPSSRDSCLRIFFQDELPHLPSKWSVLKISVEIISENKSYRGNIGNLRQLHSKGTVGGLLNNSQFSLQEKQIVRYLSFNADYEDSSLLLNAEKASDFFHCLVGFKNVFCNSTNLSFFPEPCDLAVGEISGGTIKKIVPLISTKLSYFNLENSSFVIGQNGVWVGIFGNYFWIPGSRDVKWIRDFARYNAKFANDEEFNAEIEKFKVSGLEIVSGYKIPKNKKETQPKPILLANFAGGRELRLTLLFRYADAVFPADFKNAGLCAGSIIERNTFFESNFERRLLFAGFKKDMKTPGLYSSSNSELSGLFMRKFSSEWSADVEIYVKGATNLIEEAKRNLPAALHTRLVSEDNEGFNIECEIRSGKEKIPIDKILKACEDGSAFIETEDKALVEIPDELKKFVLATKDMLRNVNGSTLRISKAQSLAWDSFSEDFSQNRIAKITEFRNGVKLHPPHLVISNEFSGSLREYQNEGVAWMLSRFENGLNCMLADEMGLGKTVQTISLLLEMKTKYKDENRPNLIVCPSSLTENWQMEIAKFAPTLKCVRLHGMERERIWNETSNPDVIISSYSTFKRDIIRHSEKKYRLLVLDEAQHIKNPETGNARSCKKINAAHKLVLTGTPIENAPIEIWSIVDFLHPGILGTHNSFKKQHSGSENNDEALKRLAVKISPLILRRRKMDVLPQLPPKTEQMLYCEMDDSQAEAYEKIRLSFRKKFEELSSGGIKAGTKFELLTLLLRLRQFCCHPSLLPDEFQSASLPSAKTELLKELILEAGDSGQKTLVFSQFPSLLKIIAAWLDSRHVSYEYLDGSTSDRMERVRRFNSEKECGVFLLSIKAGGFGLNLNSAERVIIYDPWWNPAVEQQAADRAHRIGQTKPVVIQKLLVKNSIEEKILSMQERKKRYFDNLMEEAPSVFKNLSLQEIKALFD
ncbi:MAG TPA: DEAD/DEAH box helicase [Victivallales bacterium]|nr:DEAD/DEAH box helicase [Victivallales bacterium]